MTRQPTPARGTSKTADPVLKPTLILVGAQKGGVGKTTTSRLLMHWLDETRRSHVGFDTEFPQGSLQRFYPNKTEIVDIAEVSDQMRVFDALAGATDNSVFVLDMRAGYFFNILDKFDDLMLFREARDGAFNLVFLHVMGGSIESIAEVEAALPRFDGAKHVVVRNPANGADLTLWDDSDVRRTFELQGGMELKIPALHPLAYQAIDRASATFRDFAENRLPNGAPADFSYTLRAYTKNWLIHSMIQIDRLKI